MTSYSGVTLKFMPVRTGSDILESSERGVDLYYDECSDCLRKYSTLSCLDFVHFVCNCKNKWKVLNEDMHHRYVCS